MVAELGGGPFVWHSGGIFCDTVAVYVWNGVGSFCFWDAHCCDLLFEILQLWFLQLWCLKLCWLSLGILFERPGLKETRPAPKKMLFHLAATILVKISVFPICENSNTLSSNTLVEFPNVYVCIYIYMYI